MSVTRLMILLLLLPLIANGICERILADEDARECADCHSDSPAFREWQKSEHANSLETLLDVSGAEWTCLRCHSDDYKGIRELVRNTSWESVDDMPTVRSAHSPVSCSACHKHDSGMRNNLAKPANRICNTCHVRHCGG